MCGILNRPTASAVRRVQNQSAPGCPSVMRIYKIHVAEINVRRPRITTLLIPARSAIGGVEDRALIVDTADCPAGEIVYEEDTVQPV